MSAGKTTEMDASYVAREQTWVKHVVLRKYLEQFAPVVGSAWTTINYVDCFSGPWEAVAGDLADTSFSIALQVLRQARETLRVRFNRTVHLRCFFIEKDPTAYARLKKFAGEAGTDVEIETRNGEFESLIPEILQFVRKPGPRKSFSFIFIDPTGWSGFALKRIKPLLRLEPGEVLINFMTSFIRRFIETKSSDEVRKAFEGLFGRPDFAGKLAGVAAEDRDDVILEMYREELKSISGYRYVCSTPVLNPTKDTTHFHLVYGTRSPKGLEVFKNAEKPTMAAMEQARAAAQQDAREGKSGQPELFGSQDMHRAGYYERLRDRSIARSRALVERELRGRTRIPYDEAWEIALGEQLVWDTDLKQWIREWCSQGALTIEGLKPKQRVPHRGAGQALVWRGGK